MYVHKTTVELSEEDLKFIRDRGMTLVGAFRAGVRAIQRAEDMNEKIMSMERNIAKLQERLARYMLMKED